MACCFKIVEAQAVLVGLNMHEPLLGTQHTTHIALRAHLQCCAAIGLRGAWFAMVWLHFCNLCSCALVSVVCGFVAVFCVCRRLRADVSRVPCFPHLSVCHTTILSFFGCAIVCGHPFSVLFLFAVVAVIVVIVLLLCLCVMLGLCCGLVIVVAWLRLLLALLSPCGFYHVVFQSGLELPGFQVQ